MLYTLLPSSPRLGEMRCFFFRLVESSLSVNVLISCFFSSPKIEIGDRRRTYTVFGIFAVTSIWRTDAAAAATGKQYGSRGLRILTRFTPQSSSFVGVSGKSVRSRNLHNTRVRYLVQTFRVVFWSHGSCLTLRRSRLLSCLVAPNTVLRCFGCDLDTRSYSSATRRNNINISVLTRYHI